MNDTNGHSTVLEAEGTTEFNTAPLHPSQIGVPVKMAAKHRRQRAFYKIPDELARQVFVEYDKLKSSSQIAEELNMHVSSVNRILAGFGRFALLKRQHRAHVAATRPKAASVAPVPSDAAGDNPLSLIHSMLEAVGPYRLGWAKLPQGTSLPSIINELSAGHELMGQAIERFKEWASAFENNNGYE